MMRRALLLYIGISVSILLLFGLNLTTGSVQIPFTDVIFSVVVLQEKRAGNTSY